MDTDFLHPEITEKILAASFQVHNTLGAGFLEKVYENALALELRARGIAYEQQKPIAVRYRETVVGDYSADLIVEAKVIVELKASTALDHVHEAQVLNYLRATGLRVGLLLNFGRPRLEYRRLVL